MLAGGSPCCENAVDRAIELAREKSATLSAVSVVYSNDEYLALAPGDIEELIENFVQMPMDKFKLMKNPNVVD